MPKKVAKTEKVVESKTLHRDELITLIQEKDSNLTKKDVEKVLRLLPEVILEQIVAGNKVAMIQFGVFEKITRAGREIVNPQTGEKMKIPARKAMHFKISKTFNDRVNEEK